MPKDHFDPARPVPRFLAEQAEQGFGNVRDEGVVLARLFKVSLLVAAVAVIGIAVLVLGNPFALFTDATASLAGSSSPQPVTEQPAPADQSAANAPAFIQPSADAQAAPPTAGDAPVREEVAGAEPVGKTTDPASEALFRQFQAWVVDQDAQAKAEPVQPVQDAAPAPIMQGAPAPIMQEAPAPAAEDARLTHPLAQKHRHVAPVRDAQADPRAQSVRKPVPRVQDAHAARPPVQRMQDARAQEPPPQPTQAPSSFLPIFGQR
jgi:hypothetical protein